MGKPIKEKLTKSALINELAEYVPESTSARKIAAAVLEGLNDVMSRSVAPKGIGEFMLPGMLKIVTKKRPAVKAGTPVRNPATGEMMPSAGRPASMQVRARILSKLKQAAQK
ncbi:MAG: hypothetical protein ACI82H_002166 [Alphaproteobacteria bacterium]|jgi:hypothetical protein